MQQGGSYQYKAFLCHDWHTDSWYWVQASAALLSVSKAVRWASQQGLSSMLFPVTGKLTVAQTACSPRWGSTNAGLLPFRFFLGSVLMLCFFCPTPLGGDFSCSFGCIGVLQSVSNWFSMRTILCRCVSDVSGGGGECQSLILPSWALLGKHNL